MLWIVGNLHPPVHLDKTETRENGTFLLVPMDSVFQTSHAAACNVLLLCLLNKQRAGARRNYRVFITDITPAAVLYAGSGARVFLCPLWPSSFGGKRCLTRLFDDCTFFFFFLVPQHLKLTTRRVHMWFLFFFCLHQSLFAENITSVIWSTPVRCRAESAKGKNHHRH